MTNTWADMLVKPAPVAVPPWNPMMVVQRARLGQVHVMWTELVSVSCLEPLVE